MSIPEDMKQLTDFADKLVNEKSSNIPPIILEHNMFVARGWQCPICGRVYSPTTHMCFYCGNREVETITLPNTGGVPQEKSNFRNQTTSK